MKFWIVISVGVALLFEYNLFSNRLFYDAVHIHLAYPHDDHFLWLMYFDVTYFGVITSLVLGAVIAWVASFGAKAANSVSRNLDEVHLIPWLGYTLYFLNGMLTLWETYGSTSSDSVIAEIFLNIFVELPAVLLQFAFLLIGGAALVGLTVFSLPFIFFGLYAMLGTSSRTTDIAKKHSRNKRPNSAVLKELSNAMVSGTRSDLELNSILHELSPISRFFNNFTYKKKAEKYREVRALLDAQKEALDERDKLGQSALELEKMRARRYD